MRKQSSKNIFFHFIFFLFFLFQTWIGVGQDVQFSQFYSSPLYLAPSFAGSTPGGRIFSNFRDQWPQFAGEFVTYSIGFDHFLPNYNSGLGLYVLRDRAGSGYLVNTHIDLNYSYAFSIFRNIQVRPGMKLGFITRSLDYNRLIFGDQLAFGGNKPVSLEPQDFQRVTLFDFATSLMVHSEIFWAGASADHLPLPQQSLHGGSSNIPAKYTAFAGARVLTKQRLLLKDQEYYYVTALYKQQGEYKQLETGFYWEHYPMQLGLWYRGIPWYRKEIRYFHQDAIVFKVGVIFDYLNVGYSYDYTFSGLRSFSGGAHEISVTYLFNQDQVPTRKRKMAAVPCPKF